MPENSKDNAALADLYSPDALVQSSQFSHQLSGPFVLIAAQVVHSLDGLGGRLQLIFIDVDSLVLGLTNSGRTEIIKPQPSKSLVCFFVFVYLFPRFDHTGSVGQDVDVLVLVVLVDLGPRLEQRLHEQVQEGRNSDLEPREEGRKR